MNIDKISWEGYIGSVSCPEQVMWEGDPETCSFTMYLYEDEKFDAALYAQEHFDEMHAGRDANYPGSWHMHPGQAPE